jgi:hypothetical protein
MLNCWFKSGAIFLALGVHFETTIIVGVRA